MMTSLFPEIETKCFSADMEGDYRYSLTRRWDMLAPVLVVCMLNPSTADADKDDPTIRRLYTFAKREGFGGFHVVNLFAYRSTDPKILPSLPDPVGPRNDETIKWLALESRTVLCAWGAVHKSLRLREKRVREILAAYKNQYGIRAVSLGTTAEGFPCHPLYRPDVTPFSDFDLGGKASA